MTVFWWVTGLLLALIWADRLRDAVAGMPAIPDIASDEYDRVPLANGASPRVSIVTPARNEEARVEAGLRSLLGLEYPDYEVLAVNDRSTDKTGDIMERVAADAHAGSAELRVLHIDQLPDGWLGKPHAMWRAAQQAGGDWILFTDADVVFRPDCLRRAITYGEQSKADHLVLFPSYRLHGIGETMMIAGFSLLFVFGHRPWKVSDPRAKDFMGLGPFNLIRRSAYEKVGTFRALRMEVIEDMKLGKLVKEHGLAQRNVFGRGLLDWQWGQGALGLVRNLTKNLFASMMFRWKRALGACLALLFLNLTPFLGVCLAPGWAKAGFVVALGAIAGLYLGMSRRSPIPPWYFITHPLSTLLLLYAMLRSMGHAWRHGGVVWRGTRYSLEELRRGLV